MRVSVDERVKKDLGRLSIPERARVNRVVNLFRDEGFLLNELHLKKLTRKIWELRPGRIRLLFGIAGDEAIIVNIFAKKTAKTPLKEIQLAERRIAEYHE